MSDLGGLEDDSAARQFQPHQLPNSIIFPLTPPAPVVSHIMPFTAFLSTGSQ